MSGQAPLAAERKPKASYLKPHRAACHTVNGVPARGQTWTTDYIKVCSTIRADLDSWAQHKVGGKPTPCGQCNPL